jgi:hypothetical protein
VLVPRARESAHKLHLHGHVLAGEVHKIFHECQTHEIVVMLAEEIDVGQRPLRLELCENDKQLPPDMPHRLFAFAAVEAQARQRHDLHQMFEQALGNVAAGGEVQAVVFDERHRVLIQLEQHVVVVFLHHNVADNVRNVVDRLGMEQVMILYLYFVLAECLESQRQKTDGELPVQLHLDICAALLQQQQFFYFRAHCLMYWVLILLDQPAQDRLRDLSARKKGQVCACHVRYDAAS